MRVEMNFDKEFPNCGDAVRKLVRKLGHTPVDPIKIEVGMRVELIEAEPEEFDRNQKAIVLEDDGETDEIKVAFDYYTSAPVIMVMDRDLFRACVNR